MNNYPAIVVIAPLLGAFFAGITAWVEDRFTYPIALTSLGIACYAAIGDLCIVLTSVPRAALYGTRLSPESAIVLCAGGVYLFSLAYRRLRMRNRSRAKTAVG